MKLSEAKFLYGFSNLILWEAGQIFELWFIVPTASDAGNFDILLYNPAGEEQDLSVGRNFETIEDAIAAAKAAVSAWNAELLTVV